MDTVVAIVKRIQELCAYILSAHEKGNRDLEGKYTDQLINEAAKLKAYAYPDE